MKKVQSDEVHDFSAHWSMNLPEQKLSLPKLRPSKPRAYKSIHSSEYNERPIKQLSKQDTT